ncbi:hypothetical protein Tco_0819244 [Tanacetum coccineum]|uniref:Uncharacterized protein n=1 Tax=Tanacetum coccineum TaxID=301880 RepID=A0ABQ5A5Z6_9ASTR
MQGETEGFNTGNASDESNQIIQRVPRTESTLIYKPRMQVMGEMLQVYRELKTQMGLIQEMHAMKAIRLFSHYARECQKPKVHDAKYFREQMLLAMKDEAGSNLSNKENDFMLDTSYGEDLEELTATVHASSKVHEQVSHGKRQTIIQTTDDDQIDSNIIFDGLFVENNVATFEHDSTAHAEYHEIQMLAYNLEKKAFKDQEDRYLDDIFDLKEKLSSHDRIVYKMGQSIQTIHMLGKKPNKVYDPFLKAGLGYTNPERLKKVM